MMQCDLCHPGFDNVVNGTFVWECFSGLTEVSSCASVAQV